jgi:hypothetical protein
MKIYLLFGNNIVIQCTAIFVWYNTNVIKFMVMYQLCGKNAVIQSMAIFVWRYYNTNDIQWLTTDL